VISSITKIELPKKSGAYLFNRSAMTAVEKKLPMNVGLRKSIRDLIRIRDSKSTISSGGYKIKYEKGSIVMKKTNPALGIKEQKTRINLLVKNKRYGKLRELADKGNCLAVEALSKIEHQKRRK